jgi:hypothetical protein
LSLVTSQLYEVQGANHAPLLLPEPANTCST